MQNQVTVFRTMIVVSLVLSLIGGFIDFLIPGLVPESLTQAYEAYTEAEASLTAILGWAAVSIVLMLVAVISTVGLLVLQPWARPFALWSTAVSLLLYFFLGAVVQSGVAVALTSTAMALWGAALSMAFYSEVRSHFERPPA